MKRILFVAPEAFPVKTSESICNSKVAHSLAEAGYKVDVFTCSNMTTYPLDNKVDAFLRTSSNLTIFHVDSNFQLSRQYSFKKNFKNGLKNLAILLRTGYWYNGISIPYGILSAIKKRMKELGGMPYDVLITRGFNTDYVGIYLSKRYNIKWIANWNDPYPVKRFPAPYGQGYDAQLPYFENRIYNLIQKYADIHTFPSDRLRKYMLKCFTHIDESQTMVIPHMAHSELFPIVKGVKVDNGVFKIVHCGSVGKPRDPRNFVKGLSKLVEENNLTGRDIKCYFVGNYDNNLADIVKDNGLSDIVELLPPKGYTDSLSFISTCDMALIIEAICEEGIYLPTKFVDSIQCGLPVFCVSPREGTLKDMVDKYGVGYHCDNTSVIDVEDKLRAAYKDYLNRQLPVIDEVKVDYFFENNINSLFKSIIE